MVILRNLPVRLILLKTVTQNVMIVEKVVFLGYLKILSSTNAILRNFPIRLIPLRVD